MEKWRGVLALPRIRHGIRRGARRAGCGAPSLPLGVNLQRVGQRVNMLIQTVLGESAWPIEKRGELGQRFRQ